LLGLAGTMTARFAEKLRLSLCGLISSKFTVELLIFPAAAAVVLRWVPWNSVIYFWDVYVPIDAQSQLARVCCAWMPSPGVGIPNGGLVLVVMIYIYYLLTHSLGLPFYLAQKVYLYTSLTLGGTTFYAYCRSHDGSNSLSRIGAVAGALLYSYNPYSFTTTYLDYANTLPLIIGCLPALLLLIEKVLQMAKVSLSKALTRLFILLPLTTLFAFTGYAFYIPILVPALSTILFSIFLGRKDKISLYRVATFVMILIAMSLAFNAWWVLPTLAFYSTPLAQAAGASFGYASFFALGSSYANLMRLSGWEQFYQGLFYSYPPPWLPWGNMYLGASLLLTLVSMVIPATVLVGLWCTRRNAKTRFLSILLIIAIPAAAGLRGPLGFIYEQLLNGKFAGLLRTPSASFGMVLVFATSYLFGSGISVITKRPSRHRLLGVLLASLILFSAVGVYAWPMWTGQFLPRGIYHSVAEVPQSTLRAAEFLRAHGATRFIIFPGTNNLILTNWHSGSEPLMDLTDSSVIWLNDNNLTAFLYRLQSQPVDTIDGTSIRNIVRVLGVQYTVLRYDAIFIPIVTLPFKNASLLFLASGGGAFPMVFNDENYVIFRVTDPLPDVYSPEAMSLCSRDCLSIMSNRSFIPTADALVSVDPPQVGYAGNIQGEMAHAKISFGKESWSEWTVESQSNGPFALVLTQAYDASWEIFENNTPIKAQHFVANALFNGWIIDESGTHHFRIVFQPQILLDNGISISVISLFAALVITLFWSMRERWRTHSRAVQK